MLKLRLAAVLLVLAAPAFAQLPVVGNPDQEAMLRSADSKLAANKRLVYDFWRTLLEARHMEDAPKYMAESYRQHNPNVPTGRAHFVEFFSKLPRQDLKPQIQRPLVGIIAEGDVVVLAFAVENPDPRDKTKKYTTTWFDMFRIENGKVAEHWDGDRIAPPPG